MIGQDPIINDCVFVPLKIAYFLVASFVILEGQIQAEWQVINKDWEQEWAKAG